MASAVDHPLQQGIMLTDEEWKGFDEVDEVVKGALISGTPIPIAEYGQQLKRAGFLTGVKLAKLLWKLEEVWEAFETDMLVEDFCFSEMGVAVETFTKYSSMFRWVLANENIALPIRRKLAGKPIGGLILLTAGARDGSFTEEQWMQLARAPDKKTMQDLVREARGTQTSGHSRVTITWEKDGRLTAWKGDEGEPHPCGYLPRDYADDVVETAVERIINGIGVVRR